MLGQIFIPDISGFTHFVNSIDIELGVRITRDLLNVIIDSNPLPLELSEIEGDAVLFYRLGAPLPLDQLLAGFRHIQQAFADRFAALKQAYGLQASLSLKLIVHYGDISVYGIRGFTKLYGQTVVEAHRLLKNGAATDDYILVTEDYLQALCTRTASPGNWHTTAPQSSHFSGLRCISYCFYTYAALPAARSAAHLQVTKTQPATA